MNTKNSENLLRKKSNSYSDDPEILKAEEDFWKRYRERQRMKKEDPEAYQRYLDSLPDHPVMYWDEWK